MIEHDIIVKMPPKRRYTIKAKVKVKKARLRRDDGTGFYIIC